MPICNRFDERMANNGKIMTFTEVLLFDALVHVSLNLKNRDLDHRKLRSMLKISYAAWPYLSLLISVQFALEMCLAARNLQKIHKNAYFSIQNHPRSLNLVAIESQCMTSHW